MERKRWSRYSKNIYEKEYNDEQRKKAEIVIEKLHYYLTSKQMGYR